MQIWIAFFGALTIVSNHFIGETSEVLRWKWKAGDQRIVLVDQHSEIQVDDSLSEKVVVHLTKEILVTVGARDSNDFTSLELSVQRLSMTVNDRSGEHQFSTDAPATDDAKNAYWAAELESLNKPTFIGIDSQGIARNLNPQEVTRKSETLLSSTSSGEWGLGIEFPEAIQVGKPWNRHTSIPLGNDSKLLTDTQFIMVGKELIEGKNLRRIKFSSGLRIESKEKYPEITKQDFVGTSWFDVDDGFLSRLESSQEIVVRPEKGPSQRLVQILEISVFPVDKN